MNIPQNTDNIEWPNIEYEYLRTYCESGESLDHTKHLNKKAESGWELIHVHNCSSNYVQYIWRKLKILGVTTK